MGLAPTSGDPGWSATITVQIPAQLSISVSPSNPLFNQNFTVTGQLPINGTTTCIGNATITLQRSTNKRDVEERDKEQDR